MAEEGGRGVLSLHSGTGGKSKWVGVSYFRQTESYYDSLPGRQHATNNLRLGMRRPLTFMLPLPFASGDEAFREASLDHPWRGRVFLPYYPHRSFSPLIVGIFHAVSFL